MTMFVNKCGAPSAPNHPRRGVRLRRLRPAKTWMKRSANKCGAPSAPNHPRRGVRLKRLRPAKTWMRRSANKCGAKSVPNHPKRSASQLTLWIAIRKISAQRRKSVKQKGARNVSKCGWKHPHPRLCRSPPPLSHTPHSV